MEDSLSWDEAFIASGPHDIENKNRISCRCCGQDIIEDHTISGLCPECAEGLAEEPEI